MPELASSRARVVPAMPAPTIRTSEVSAGMPTVLPELRHDLGLSYSASGALTSIVLATLGLGSVPGAILGARLGAQRTVTFTSIGLGLAAAARLLPPQVFWVFAGTVGLAL